MKFFVFDLEATCWEYQTNNQQEIIEIGICIVDEYGRLSKSFSSFIKPVLNPSLSNYCKNLTGINQSDVEKAKIFPIVIEQILDWAEIPDEEYVFCAWGTKDYKLIESDARLHRIDIDWLSPYIDAKSQYHQNRELENKSGLYKVLKKNGFEFDGPQHRALSDASNLAKIISKYIDEWVF
ncbi:MAG: exonuclease domain-containing protein [Saprospiraceae bacterium]|nr:exonuclease domain-containing protein [Saprospiraceae bacterium]